MEGSWAGSRYNSSTVVSSATPVLYIPLENDVYNGQLPQPACQWTTSDGRHADHGPATYGGSSPHISLLMSSKLPIMFGLAPWLDFSNEF